MISPRRWFTRLLMANSVSVASRASPSRAMVAAAMARMVPPRQ
jgi:hypothetical protein